MHSVVEAFYRHTSLTMLAEKTEATASVREKIAAAFFYGATSFVIMLINKVLLTTFSFPSFQFVALIQYAGSLVVLGVQRWVTHSVSFPAPSWDVVKQVFPLPFIFLANTMTGLGATKSLNMPMFVLLRRFSIVMTMFLEMYLLSKRYKSNVYLAVTLMVLGAFIAAAGDLHLEFYGCAMVLGNDLFTALQGVVLRQKMDKDKKDRDNAVTSPGPQKPHPESALGTHGLMFYNNLFSLPIVAAMLFNNPKELQQLHEFDRWGNKPFLFCLFFSSVVGFVLNYSYFMCTKLNSALTTTVIGSLKNILTTYLGMIFFPDYTFTLLSFSGVTVSVAGSLFYNYVEIQRGREMQLAKEKEREQRNPV